MATINISTYIKAPIERCFDLARDIDFHSKSVAHTGERAVAGTISGLIGPGEEVTWEAKHICVRQRFTVRITAFERPTYFQDIMIRGAFKTFVHDHRFAPSSEGTLMTDELTFHSPFWLVGTFVDLIFIKRYLQRLIEMRCDAIKQAAER